jgi:exodeoxyribonuclease V alpha subunit
LGVPAELIAPALDRLSREDRIRADMIPIDNDKTTDKKVGEARADYKTPVIYLTPLYFGEKGIAERLKKLAGVKLPPLSKNIAQASTESLSEEQRSALEMALTHPISILTGGPGTGKTTCLKALITALESAHKRVALASPTGRAAKRLSEATGRSARTIHRLLEYSPIEGFQHNEENPLDVDFLVVDEASMLDLLLTYNLLKALRPGTQLLFVGDVDQLPAVGAGDVLRDLIDSGMIPVARLNVIFRQAANSQIIINAHLINQGKFPTFSKESGDFFLFPADEVEAAADWIVQVVSERIPQKFGFDPIRDIQVLAPLYRGAAGVSLLNERLQEKLNPPASNKPERKLYGTLFRLGDKVMQTRNNYDKDVYNGDIGFVSSLDVIEQTLGVDFDGRSVPYDWSDGDQLTLAYVVSVHKAQGSEFPVVVMPVVTQHYMMLQRNLLYTAVTRARKLCVLTGSRRAISIAIHNNKVIQRFTALEWRLRGHADIPA